LRSSISIKIILEAQSENKLTEKNQITAKLKQPTVQNG